MCTFRLLPRALLPLALVLSLVVVSEPASAGTRCRWDSERVCKVLSKAKRMAQRSHNRTTQVATHRMPDYGYTSKQRRAVRKRPVIDIGQPRRYASPRHHVRKGGGVRYHRDRGSRPYGCRTRWWAFEEESLVFRATLYRVRFTVR